MKTKFAAPLALASAVAAAFLFQSETSSQSFSSFNARDPGVRFGPAGAGGPIDGLTANELAFFQQGKDDFEEAEEADEGLGPTMNLDGCGGCHAQPATGGTSPAVNPQVAFANKDGAQQPHSVVHPRRRAGARGTLRARIPTARPTAACTRCSPSPGATTRRAACCAQPDFATQVANQQRHLPHSHAGVRRRADRADPGRRDPRQPGGQREPEVRARHPRQAEHRGAGNTISGQTNNNGNDGTIARFGWKAQNKSLLLFSGEAYNVEMGITSELFQTERDETPSCQFATVPNATQNFDATTALAGTTAIQNFANFQRFLAPPTPSSDSPGGADSIGARQEPVHERSAARCATRRRSRPAIPRSRRCATRTSTCSPTCWCTTWASGWPTASPRARPGRGSSAPRRCGASGKRIFFLHDGRTSDLEAAIQAAPQHGSEANDVVSNFNNLRESSKQDLLNFLRSL